MVRKLVLGFGSLAAGVVMLAAGWLLALTPARAQAQPVAPAADAAALASQVIRLHVIANSDSDADQELKRAVRDAILAEVTPLFDQVTTQGQARAAIAAATPRIRAAAERVIAAAGKDYSVRIELGRFHFPTKAYGTILLPAGEYTALRVLIGQAKGANWWCVLFPPLCFLDWNTGVVLEPKPGTQGRETVTVPRKEASPLLAEDDLNDLPVRPRFRVAQWLKGESGAAPAPSPENVPPRRAVPTQ